MKQTENLQLPILQSGDKYTKETQNEAFEKVDLHLGGLAKRVNYIVANGGESNIEIVDARRDNNTGVVYNTLGERIDSVSEQLDTKANKSHIWNMANMGQDVKEAMTGGSVAVVGNDTIGFNNLNIDMKNNYGDFIDLELTLLNGYYDTNMGSTKLNSHSSYKTVECPCTYGDTFSCDVYVASDTMAKVIFWSEDGTKLSYLGKGDIGQYENFIFNIPKNVVKLSISSNISLGSVPILKKVIPIKSKDLDTKIITLNERLDSIIYKDNFKVVETELLTGFYNAASSTTNITSNSNYKSLKINCLPGEVYNADMYVASNTMAKVIFWGKDGNVVGWLGKGDVGQHNAFEFTVPDDASSLSITSNIALGTNPIVRKREKIEVIKDIYTKINSLNSKISTKDMVALFDGEKLLVRYKYDSNNDIEIDFRKCGGNNIPNIYQISKIANKDITPSSNFNIEKTMILNSGTDWLGPYVISAINNIDGDTTSTNYFTGGWHNYTGNIASAYTKENATARNEYFEVYADGNNLNGTVECNLITIKFKNYIQASNTKKSDGSGREILSEEYLIKITPKNCMEIECEIECLEDLKMTTYYGLQTNFKQIASTGSILLFDGVGSYTKNDVTYDLSKHYIPMNVSNTGAILFTGGTKNNGSKCRKIRVKDSKINCECYVNKDGIGDMRYVANDFDGTLLYSNYAKVYFTQVKNTNMSKGQILNWNGGYKFY